MGAHTFAFGVGFVGSIDPVDAGVRLVDGTVIPRVGGFIRPRWHAPVEFLDAQSVERDDWGLIRVSDQGETSTRGVYAVGDIVRGASLVVWAIRDGRDCAEHVLQDLDKQAVIAAE